MYNRHVEMQVCVNGAPVREHRKDGLAYIEARKGSSYSIKLKNHFNRRALAILSVDGIEVLTGKKAGEAESGYVLEPYSSIEIKGYRISDNEVATFVFGSGYNSYSTYQGQQSGELKPGEKSPNNGVIGVRIILEKYTEPNWNVHKGAHSMGRWMSSTGCLMGYSGYMTSSPLKSSSSSRKMSKGHGAKGQSVGGSTMARGLSTTETNWVESDSLRGSDPNEVTNLYSLCSNGGLHGTLVGSVDFTSAAPIACAAAAVPDFEVGTEWGAKTEDRVKQVDFQPSEEVFEMALYYTTREALERIGIDFTSKKSVAGLPQAFGGKYCPAPKGYK